MIPQNQAILLIVAFGFIGVVVVLALKRRGVQPDSGAPSPTPARAGKTRIQTTVKLARLPGAKTDFPKLRVMSTGPSIAKLDGVEVKAVRDDGREARADAGVAPGTPINPEPGDEIDLSPAFRQIAAQLCDSFGSKARVKYSVALRESVRGLTIPIEIPQRTADLWQDGLEDIVGS